MSLVSPATVKSLVPTPLTDAALQVVIDRIEADITAIIGEPSDGTTTQVTEEHGGGVPDLYLKRPIAAMVSVTEYAALTDSTGTSLTEGTDYYAWDLQGKLQRIGTKWGARSTVVYTPVDERDKRTQAVIDLTRVYLSMTPFRGENVGREYSYSAPENWELEVRKIVRRLQFPII